jgi:hypothetical protein
MNVSAIRANGIDLPLNGLRKQTDRLSQTPNPVDAVNLSESAVETSEHHIAYSLEIKTEKIRDEIANVATNLFG